MKAVKSSPKNEQFLQLNKRKAPLMIICFILLANVTGCIKPEKTNIDFSQAKTEIIDESIQKMEILNILNDADIFIDLEINAAKSVSKVLTSNDSDELKVKKNAMIYYDLMNEVNRIATNRIASDIGTLYTNSEKYASYLAMLQVYADTYNEEKETMYKNLINYEDGQLKKMKSYRMFCEIEDFYISLYSYNEE